MNLLFHVQAAINTRVETVVLGWSVMFSEKSSWSSHRRPLSVFGMTILLMLWRDTPDLVTLCVIGYKSRSLLVEFFWDPDGAALHH